MTTMYKPVLIESAEQAEALPDGIIATRANRWPLQKNRGVWPTAWDTLHGRELVGWTALVPVEAEEETAPSPFSHRSRYVTPWEES